MLFFSKFIYCVLLYQINKSTGVEQLGPDPWDFQYNGLSKNINNDDIPPDLKLPPTQKEPSRTENSLGMKEWFYRRILTILLNGGQLKENDDGSMDISIKMRFDHNRWETLKDYVTSNKALSDDMYRRSLGYVEEAIYKPSIIEEIVTTWNDTVQMYFVHYKNEITWSLGIMSAVGLLFWMWSRMTHRHVVLLVIIILYLYEVFISYKEAEKQEVDRFLSAINKCSWLFWKTECDIPPPDPIVFMKHMNPLKIGVRMFATLVSEPMIAISNTMNTIIHGITDGLWFPFNSIVYGILIVTFNVLIMFTLIMVLFNFILNVPFKLSIFSGLINIGLKQRRRSVVSHERRERVQRIDDGGDRISEATVNKLLDVCSQAFSSAHLKNHINETSSTRLRITNNSNTLPIRRSASAGRLSNVDYLSTENNFKRIELRKHVDCSGDAH